MANLKSVNINGALIRKEGLQSGFITNQGGLNGDVVFSMANHGLIPNQPIVFTASTGTNTGGNALLPAPITAGTTYYVKEGWTGGSSYFILEGIANNFHLSATLGGANIAWGSGFSGVVSSPGHAWTVPTASSTVADPPGIGTQVSFRTTKTMSTPASAYTKSGQTVILYEDEADDEGYACVGTYIPTTETLTFGSLLNVPGTGTLKGCSIAYDPDNDKVLTAWAQPGGNHNGTMAVGTVAGTGSSTTISFGSHVWTNSGSLNIPDGGHKKQGIVWVGGIGGDTTNRLVLAMLNDGNSAYGRATVVTISGTTPTAANWRNITTAGQGAGDICMAYVGSGQVVVAYVHSGVGYCRVGTVNVAGPNTIDWSTNEYQYSAGGVDPGWSGTKNSIAYDANAGKFLIAYIDSTINTQGRAKVGTVTGTGASASIAFGTEQVFDTNATDAISVVYHTAAQKSLIAYNPGGAGNITAKSATITGTDVAFGSALVLDTSNPDNISSSYDSQNQIMVIAWVAQSTSVGNSLTVDFSKTTITVNLSAGNYFEVDLQGQENIKAFTITETLTGTQAQTFYLKITQGSTTRSIIWPQITNVKWPGGTGPTITATDNAIDILKFTTYDQGTTWHGETIGQNFS